MSFAPGIFEVLTQEYITSECLSGKIVQAEVAFDMQLLVH